MNQAYVIWALGAGVSIFSVALGFGLKAGWDLLNDKIKSEAEMKGDKIRLEFFQKLEKVTEGMNGLSTQLGNLAAEFRHFEKTIKLVHKHDIDLKRLGVHIRGGKTLSEEDL